MNKSSRHFSDNARKRIGFPSETKMLPHLPGGSFIGANNCDVYEVSQKSTDNLTTANM